MGVHGLWQLLHPSGRPVTLESLEGKVLAVDVSIWLHQSLKGMRDKDGNPLPNAHLQGLFSRVCKLLFYRIKPVFVFDGGVPALKKNTLAARREKKSEAQRESSEIAQKLLQNLVKSQAVKHTLGGSSGPVRVPGVRKKGGEEDIFELAPLPESEETGLALESGAWDSQFEQQDNWIREGLATLSKVDPDSEEFKSLPMEIQHEALVDLKEERKYHSLSRIGKMPEDADSFSTYQLKKLMKVCKLTTRIDDVRKQMSNKTTGEIQNELAADGENYYGDEVEARRIVSEDASHYILIKGMSKQKQQEEAEKYELERKIKIEKQEEEKEKEKEKNKDEAGEKRRRGALLLSKAVNDDDDEDDDLLQQISSSSSSSSSSRGRKDTDGSTNVPSTSTSTIQKTTKMIKKKSNDENESAAKKRSSHGEGESRVDNSSSSSVKRLKVGNNSSNSNNSHQRKQTAAIAGREAAVGGRDRESEENSANNDRPSSSSEDEGFIEVTFDPNQVNREDDLFPASIFTTDLTTSEHETETTTTNVTNRTDQPMQRVPTNSKSAAEKMRDESKSSDENDDRQSTSLEQDAGCANVGGGVGSVVDLTETRKSVLSDILLELERKKKEALQDIIISCDGEEDDGGVNGEDGLKCVVSSSNGLKVEKDADDGADNGLKDRMEEVEEVEEEDGFDYSLSGGFIRDDDSTEDEGNGYVSVRDDSKQRGNEFYDVGEKKGFGHKIGKEEDDNDDGKEFEEEEEEEVESNDRLNDSEDEDLKLAIEMSLQTAMMENRNGGLKVGRDEEEARCNDWGEGGLSVRKNSAKLDDNDVDKKSGNEKVKYDDDDKEDDDFEMVEPLEEDDGSDDVAEGNEVAERSLMSGHQFGNDDVDDEDDNESFVSGERSRDNDNMTTLDKRSADVKKRMSGLGQQTSTTACLPELGSERSRCQPEDADVDDPFFSFTRANLENLQDVLDSERNTLLSEQGKQNRFATSLTDQIVMDAQELLQLFGIPYLVSPMEAEAQCAFLDATQQTQGTITDDSDIWLFGGTRVYKNFFNQNKFVELFSMDSIRSHFSLTRDQLINIALLCGSDYTMGIQGVGPVGALEIMGEFKGEGLVGLLAFRKWWDRNQKLSAVPGESKLRKRLRDLRLERNFPSQEILEAYLAPSVDESRERFSWGRPNPDLLRQFAKVKFGWSKDKCDSVIDPMMKQVLKKQTQGRIYSYFQPGVFTPAAPIAQSDRLKKALSLVRRAGGKDEDDDDGGGEEEEEDKEEEMRRRAERVKKIMKRGGKSGSGKEVGQGLSGKKNGKNKDEDLSAGEEKTRKTAKSNLKSKQKKMNSDGIRGREKGSGRVRFAEEEWEGGDDDSNNDWSEMKEDCEEGKKRKGRTNKAKGITSSSKEKCSSSSMSEERLLISSPGDSVKIKEEKIEEVDNYGGGEDWFVDAMKQKVSVANTLITNVGRGRSTVKGRGQGVRGSRTKAVKRGLPVPSLELEVKGRKGSSSTSRGRGQGKGRKGSAAATTAMMKKKEAINRNSVICLSESSSSSSGGDGSDDDDDDNNGDKYSDGFRSSVSIKKEPGTVVNKPLNTNTTAVQRRPESQCQSSSDKFRSNDISINIKKEPGTDLEPPTTTSSTNTNTTIQQRRPDENWSSSTRTRGGKSNSNDNSNSNSIINSSSKSKSTPAVVQVVVEKKKSTQKKQTITTTTTTSSSRSEEKRQQSKTSRHEEEEEEEESGIERSGRKSSKKKDDNNGGNNNDEDDDTVPAQAQAQSGIADMGRLLTIAEMSAGKITNPSPSPLASQNESFQRKDPDVSVINALTLKSTMSYLNQRSHGEKHLLNKLGRKQGSNAVERRLEEEERREKWAAADSLKKKAAAVEERVANEKRAADEKRRAAEEKKRVDDSQKKKKEKKPPVPLSSQVRSFEDMLCGGEVSAMVPNLKDLKPKATGKTGPGVKRVNVEVEKKSSVDVVEVEEVTKKRKLQEKSRKNVVVDRNYVSRLGHESGERRAELDSVDKRSRRVRMKSISDDDDDSTTEESLDSTKNVAAAERPSEEKSCKNNLSIPQRSSEPKVFRSEKSRAFDCPIGDKFLLQTHHLHDSKSVKGYGKLPPQSTEREQRVPGGVTAVTRGRAIAGKGKGVGKNRNGRRGQQRHQGGSAAEERGRGSMVMGVVASSGVTEADLEEYGGVTLDDLGSDFSDQDF